MEKEYKLPNLNNLRETIIIESEPHSGVNPALAYKQKCIELPRNLPEVVEYTMAVRIDPRIPLSTGIHNIQRCINNIHEMLSFIIIHQNHEVQNSTTEIKPLIKETTMELQKLAKTLEPSLEKQLQKIIENIEQNRVNIKNDLEKIKLYSEEKHETLFINQQRIIDQLNEQKNNNKLLEEIGQIKTFIKESKEENIKLIELINKNDIGSKEQSEKVSKLLSEIKKENNELQMEIKDIIDKGIQEILGKI